MNPGALVALVRLMIAGFGWLGKTPAQRAPSRVGSRVAMGIFAIVVLSLWVGATEDSPRGLRMLPVLVVLGLLVLPPLLVRWVTIPLGLPRATYYIRRMALWRGKDRVGTAIMMAAWAMVRRRTPSPELGEWVARRHQDKTMGGAGLVAHGLLAAARGDRDGARAILGAVSLLDRRICPRQARVVAADWLAADAAARGDWLAVRAQRGSRTTWLLDGIAARLLGAADVPSDLTLRVRWLLAPHRVAFAPLVRRALAASGAGTRDVPEVVAVAPATDDALGLALRRHAALMQLGDLRSDELEGLAGAWDECLTESDASLRARAKALGTSDAQALAELKAEVHADLAALARQAETDLAGATGEVLSAVRSELQDQLLSEIELASRALRRRIEDQRPLASCDEWREFTALRLAYQHGQRICGRPLCRLAFPTLNTDICSLAVWLFNKRNQRPMANAMFRWLLGEARALDDERAISLHTKNVACGIG